MTPNRYFFLCGQWLAADEDDGEVDRVLPVAGQEEITGFNHLFFSTARKNLTDEHLWISIVSRPTRSTFTRLQRLTCCLVLLFTTMIARRVKPIYLMLRSNETCEFRNVTIITSFQLGSIQMQFTI